MLRLRGDLVELFDLDQGDEWFDPEQGTVWRMTRRREISPTGAIVFWCRWARKGRSPRQGVHETWFRGDRLVMPVEEGP